MEPKGSLPQTLQEKDMKDAHFTVFAAILGAVMTTVALIELIPEGKWLYLLLLVFGTQSIAMAIRATTHAEEDQE